MEEKIFGESKVKNQEESSSSNRTDRDGFCVEDEVDVVLGGPALFASLSLHHSKQPSFSRRENMVVALFLP